jgi:Flp pilus assembly CpaE family ATPase
MKNPESVGPEVLSVALVGPDAERREALAKALAESRRARVAEFHSYPAELHDLERLLAQNFDIIFVDIDSDPEFGLGLVEIISATRDVKVMVYSGISDQNKVLRCVRAGAREYLDLPLKQGVVAEALDRAMAIQNPRTGPAKKSGRLLVFLGAKGGTGVTTIACNVAIALAHEIDQSTLIIDLALPMGDAALNLGIAAKYSTDDALRNTDHLDANSLQSLLTKHRSGISVLAAPSNVPEIEASKMAIDKLMVVARQEFDNVIVDVGSRTDLMGTGLFNEASTIYLVTQAGISELRNSNRLIAQFFNEGGQNLEIVINRYEPRSLGGVNEEVITKALGKPLRWKIPDDQDATRKLRNTVTGQSIAETPISRISLEMASAITGCPIPREPKKDQGLLGCGRDNPERTPDPDDSPNRAIVTHASPRPTPTVAWSSPDLITYGDPLSAVQLNATASVPGTFVYTPASGYVLPVGTHSLWVTFYPEGSENSPVQSAVIIEVSKATPAISWPAPPVIICGAALSATELNATATEPGTFEYTPAAGEVLAPGTHTLSVTFTPANPANFTIARASVVATVAMQRPVIEWPAPDPITYDTTLSATQLNATASIPGTFDYSPAAGEVLFAGTHALTVTFNPADDASYDTVRATVSVIVAKAKPALAWLTPDPITYGTALSDVQLNATASVSGTFDYTPGPGAILAAGEHNPYVVFTAKDASNYSCANAAVSLTVRKAIPTIEWPTPNPIACGTALSGAQLNATASVSGVFEYAPAAGEVLAPGTHMLSATFTPTDALNYSTVEATVSITVTDVLPASITWPAPSAISYGIPLGSAQLNATVSAEGTLVYTPPAGVVLAPGIYPLFVSFTAVDTARCGPAQATAALEVQGLPNIASLLTATTQTPVAAITTVSPTAPTESQEVTSGGEAIQENQRKTRTYKGAVYVQGDDGQWHLQQK